MTQEEKQYLKDTCDKLPKLPRCLPTGEPITIKKVITGQHLIDYRKVYTAAGLKLPKILSPNDQYAFDQLDYLDPISLFKKAMMNGRLGDAVNKWYKNYEKFQAWELGQNSNNTDQSNKNNDYETKEPNTSISTNHNGDVLCVSADVQSES